ncbi:hypothetical protein PUR49_08175 [Streptomyces sp. BE147]|uniref:hypothetical protein n=1 Tax=Streptomyces sp. BE147 TaxID=3002524 RepID=UPI002E761D0D|nr:hypothetical protein [Streptomyces sp. BE147]MEE1736475.1 hypothetical protein [Streptomyces sp. BE147]
MTTAYNPTEAERTEHARKREAATRPAVAEVFVNHSTREAGMRLEAADGHTHERDFIRFGHSPSPSPHELVPDAVAEIEKRGFFVSVNGEPVEAPQAGWYEGTSQMTRTTIRADISPSRAYLDMVKHRYAPRESYNPKPVVDLPAGWTAEPKPWGLWELNGPDGGAPLTLTRRADLAGVHWVLWDGVPYDGPRIGEGNTCAEAIASLTAELAAFDMYGIRLGLDEWSAYRIDAWPAVYGPGWWPFRKHLTEPAARPATTLQMPEKTRTGRTRPTSLRISPNCADRAWRNEYALVHPHRDDLPTATALLRLVHSRTGRIDTHTVHIVLNIEDGTVTLPNSCPPHLRHEAEVKGARILTLIARGRMEREAGIPAPLALTEYAPGAADTGQFTPPSTSKDTPTTTSRALPGGSSICVRPDGP